MEDFELLREELSCGIGTVDLWNRNILTKMRERSDEYKRLAHAEAKRRGYEYDKELTLYREPWKMYALKGRNCIAAGWQNITVADKAPGVLRMAFAGMDGSRFYMYPGIEQEVCLKLQRSPFPDKLFTQIVKSKWHTFIPA
jgi:hypothetical protein